MSCITLGGGTTICVGGEDLLIVVDGREYLFENHPRLGPCPISKRDGSERQLGPQHRFWHAVSCWRAQGSHVADGVAQWSEPPDEFAGFVRFGRHLVSPSIAKKLGLKA